MIGAQVKCRNKQTLSLGSKAKNCRSILSWCSQLTTCIIYLYAEIELPSNYQYPITGRSCQWKKGKTHLCFIFTDQAASPTVRNGHLEGKGFETKDVVLISILIWQPHDEILAIYPRYIQDQTIVILNNNNLTRLVISHSDILQPCTIFQQTVFYEQIKVAQQQWTMFWSRYDDDGDQFEKKRVDGNGSGSSHECEPGQRGDQGGQRAQPRSWGSPSPLSLLLPGGDDGERLGGDKNWVEMEKTPACRSSGYS